MDSRTTLQSCADTTLGRLRKPTMSCSAASLIGSPDMVQALCGKLLVSILAGVTIQQIEAILDMDGATPPTPMSDGTSSSARYAIVRAMPNTASMVQASTTVITSSTSSPEVRRIVDWLFSSIGSVTYIPASVFDVCTALCGSTPAFFALFLESLVDGAVSLGLKRSDARAMAAEIMKGTAQMILEGNTLPWLARRWPRRAAQSSKGCINWRKGG